MEMLNNQRIIKLRIRSWVPKETKEAGLTASFGPAWNSGPMMEEVKHRHVSSAFIATNCMQQVF
jgi:hypothetical protein